MVPIHTLSIVEQYKECCVLASLTGGNLLSVGFGGAVTCLCSFRSVAVCVYTFVLRIWSSGICKAIVQDTCRTGVWLGWHVR